MRTSLDFVRLISSPTITVAYRRRRAHGSQFTLMQATAHETCPMIDLQPFQILIQEVDITSDNRQTRSSYTYFKCSYGSSACDWLRVKRVGPLPLHLSPVVYSHKVYSVMSFIELLDPSLEIYIYTLLGVVRTCHAIIFFMTFECVPNYCFCLILIVSGRLRECTRIAVPGAPCWMISTLNYLILQNNLPLWIVFGAPGSIPIRHVK